MKKRIGQTDKTKIKKLTLKINNLIINGMQEIWHIILFLCYKYE